MPHGFKLTLLSAAISASTGAQTTLPHNAIAYVPALSTITPDRESAQLGQQRTIRQGETIFSFDVQAPPSAMLLGAVDVNEDGQTIRLESGIHLEPFEITGISEGSLPSQIYCSKNGSAASTFAGRALSNSGARQSRICLADVDSNGTFDHVLLDAVFPKGVISPLARNLKSIEPIKYEIEGQRKRLLLGRYSIYFRGFPFPSNKFTVAMRLDGTKNSRPNGSIIADSGDGFIEYYISYSFIQYNPLDTEIVDFLGAQIEIEAVDRISKILTFKIIKTEDSRMFTVGDYGNFVPKSRNFNYP